MIGILGLQGDYAAHGKMLDAIDTPNRVVKKPEQLTEIRFLTSLCGVTW